MYDPIDFSEAHKAADHTSTEVGTLPSVSEEAIQAAFVEQMKQGEAIQRMAQLEAWQQFQKDHPIAARKAKQKAEEEARRYTRVNLMFGSVTLTGRE
jgi:hypothetical protein